MEYLEPPSHQNQWWESGTFWLLEGFILYLRGKGDLLAVPVYSVRDCNLGQNRWKSKVKIDPTQGWDVLASPWFWSDGGPVPPHRQHTHTGQYRVQPVLKINYTRGLYRVSCGLHLPFLKKRPTLIELKRQLISGAKGVDRSFFHVITQQSFNVVVNFFCALLKGQIQRWNRAILYSEISIPQAEEFSYPVLFLSKRAG